MRRRALPRNVEVIVGGKPMMVNGGATIKALSSEFLYDLQQHWRKSREQVLDDVAKKYPAQYFAGMVTLAKVIRWEVGTPGAFDRPRTPEEVMDRLEERIGPKGRKLFEQFLQKGESARGAAAAARASAAGAAAAQAVHGIAVGRLRRRPNRKGVGHSCKVSRQHDRRALIRVPAHR